MSLFEPRPDLIGLMTQSASGPRRETRYSLLIEQPGFRSRSESGSLRETPVSIRFSDAHHGFWVAAMISTGRREVTRLELEPDVIEMAAIELEINPWHFSDLAERTTRFEDLGHTLKKRVLKFRRERWNGKARNHGVDLVKSSGSEDFRQMANIAFDDFNIWGIGKTFGQSANEIRVSLHRQDPAIWACLFDNHLSDRPGTGSKFQNSVGMGPVNIGHSRK